MTWQPIETAPDDGTDVLTCDFRGQMRVLHFSEYSGEWICSAWSSYDPTHWQPLPDPPK